MHALSKAYTDKERNDREVAEKRAAEKAAKAPDALGRLSAECEMPVD